MTESVAACGPILVVEDDPEIRETLCDVLADEGYDAAAASNGREALARLEQMPRPAVILLDLMMPVMDGGEFLAVLRGSAAFATLPVIVLSAWPDEANRLQDSTQGFLKKPVPLPALLATVARFCGSTDGSAAENEP